MNKYANRGVGNEELGGCEQRRGPAGGVVGLRPAEFPRFLFASLIEVPFSQGTTGEETPQDGKSGHGSLEQTVAVEVPAAQC